MFWEWCKGKSIDLGRVFMPASLRSHTCFRQNVPDDEIAEHGHAECGGDACGEGVSGAEHCRQDQEKQERGKDKPEGAP